MLGKSTLPPWTPYPVSSASFLPKSSWKQGEVFHLRLSSLHEFHWRERESLNEHHPANLPCHSSVASETHAYGSHRTSACVCSTSSHGQQGRPSMTDLHSRLKELYSKSSGVRRSPPDRAVEQDTLRGGEIMTFKFVHQLTCLRKTLHQEVSRSKMEDHQGDGTRSFETHLPCRAFLRGPHNSAACEEQNDNTSRVYPQTRLVGLAFRSGVSQGFWRQTLSAQLSLVPVWNLIAFGCNRRRDVSACLLRRPPDSWCHPRPAEFYLLDEPTTCAWDPHMHQAADHVHVLPAGYIQKGYETVECAPCQLGYFSRSLHVPRFGVFRFCRH